MECLMSKSEGVSGGSTIWLTLAATVVLLNPVGFTLSVEPRSLDFEKLYDTIACRPRDI